LSPFPLNSPNPPHASFGYGRYVEREEEEEEEEEKRREEAEMGI
jgi:hypothetical protein